MALAVGIVFLVKKPDDVHLAFCRLWNNYPEIDFC